MQSLNEIQALLIDMDGVLWHGETPVPAINRFFDTLNSLNLPYMLATNNASKLADDYVEKLAGFGVDVPSQNILGSALATARFLTGEYPADSRIYVVGAPQLRAVLSNAGFDVLNKEHPLMKEAPPAADVVVVGFSRRTHYRHFARAMYHLNHGAQFIGTNPDLSFPTEIGPMPGAGASLALLTAATGIKPTVIGKPFPHMYNAALAHFGLPAAAVAMVGDRLHTDIEGAQGVGMGSILVMSGITQSADLDSATVKPDFVMADIGELADALLALQGSA